MSEQPDLSTWYSQPEVCRILGISKRWLNSRIYDGELSIERRKRPKVGAPRGVRGNHTEVCYHPGDVDRAAAAKAPKPAVVRDIKQTKDEQIAYLLGEIIALFERRQALAELRHATHDRGPWLTISEASAESGLRPVVIRRVLARMMEERSPDVFKDGPVLKVRRAALGGLRAKDLGPESPERLDEGPHVEMYASGE